MTGFRQFLVTYHNIDQALKIVSKLSPGERAKLSQELQLEELRYEIQKGIDAADRRNDYECH